MAVDRDQAGRPRLRREEYFVEGTARGYNGSEPSGQATYKTRIVVRRPVSPKRFEGTTVVEWFNVTGGYDAEWDWFNSHEHFTRRGWTWVGISAQYVGATALRQFNNTRYGSINHPGDTFAADIYAQAAKALRTRKGADPLGGLVPTITIADGHSQSADRLAGYYDNQQQPDSGRYRRWEIAATSHVTWKEYRESAPLIARDKGSENPRQCVKPPYSRVRFDHAQNALYDHFARWVRGGPPPPASPRIQYSSDGHTLARDGRGFAVGGIRLPELGVPTALQTGENNGVGFCILYGSREPFSDAELLQRYPDRASYVTKMDAAIKQSVEAGYLLPEDAVRLCREVRQAQLGWPKAALTEDPGCPYEAVPISAASGEPANAVAAAPTAALGLPAARGCVRRRVVRIAVARRVTRVVIVARTAKGRTLVQVRRYRGCP